MKEYNPIAHVSHMRKSVDMPTVIVLQTGLENKVINYRVKIWPARQAEQYICRNITAK